MQKYFTKKNFGWLLTGLAGLMLLFSAIGKFTGNEQMLEMFHSGGLSDLWINMIGVGAVISLALFVLPKSMRLGTLLLSAYMGGAIVFHITHNSPEHQSFTGPLVILLVTWLAAWLRGFKMP